MRSLILTLVIWTICFTAIVIGVSLTYKWYRQSGTDVRIHFKDVSGLVPHQSKIMYMGVEIGTVRQIGLDPTTRMPQIVARINKDFIPILGKHSKFWIVRPEFTLGGINNLSAVSTGDYIAVFPVTGEFKEDFIGVEEAPVDNEFGNGLNIVLKATSAQGIDIGSDVLYHDLRIGEVGEMGLADDGRHILVTIFIDPLYSRVIRKSSYFGNVSGFYADIHLFTGSKITLNSIRTLVKGGIKVETPNLNSPQAHAGDVFKLLSRDELQAIEHKAS